MVEDSKVAVLGSGTKNEDQQKDSIKLPGKVDMSKELAVGDSVQTAELVKDKITAPGSVDSVKKSSGRDMVDMDYNSIENEMISKDDGNTNSSGGGHGTDSGVWSGTEINDVNEKPKNVRIHDRGATQASDIQTEVPPLDLSAASSLT